MTRIDSSLSSAEWEPIRVRVREFRGRVRVREPELGRMGALVPYLRLKGDSLHLDPS